jgi:hypothetical protein
VPRVRIEVIRSDALYGVKLDTLGVNYIVRLEAP